MAGAYDGAALMSSRVPFLSYSKICHLEWSCVGCHQRVTFEFFKGTNGDFHAVGARPADPVLPSLVAMYTCDCMAATACRTEIRLQSATYEIVNGHTVQWSTRLVLAEIGGLVLAGF